jgi:PAS domain S-box-containing protein
METHESANLISLFPFISDQLLRVSDQKEALENVLEALGETTDSDRVYFFYNMEKNGIYGTHYFAEWCKEGVNPEINNPEVSFVAWEDVRLLFDVLNTQKSVTYHVNEISADSKSTAQVRYILESQGIMSLHLVRVYYEDWFIGFVGFDSCFKERIWTDNEVELLEYLADMVAHRYVRDAAKHKVDKLLFSINRRNDFLLSVRNLSQESSDEFYKYSFREFSQGVKKLVNSQRFGIFIFENGEYKDSTYNDFTASEIDQINLFITANFHQFSEDYKLSYEGDQIGKTIGSFEFNIENIHLNFLEISSSEKAVLIYVNYCFEHFKDYYIDYETINDVSKRLIQSYLQYLENKSIQEKIKEQKAAFEEVLEHSLSGYWYWDVLSGNEVISAGFHKALGYFTTDEKLSLLTESIFKEDRERFNHIIFEGKWWKNNSTYSEEFRFLHKKGKIITMQMALSVIDRDKNSKPLHIIACFVDITAGTLLREQLNANLIKQKELNRMKSYFVSLVSHQFRTPMTIIDANVQLIDKKIAKNKLDNLEENLDRVQLEIRKMNELISRVLVVESLNNPKIIDNDLQSINIVEFIKTQLIRYGDSKTKIYFNSDVDNKIIKSNIFKLENIFDNLISNAIKYCNSKPVNVIIQTSLDHVKLVVEDFGIGIPENEIKFIFEPFNRGSNVKEYSGTGLGLSIVKEFSEDLQIDVNLQSRKNHTVFELIIPI